MMFMASNQLKVIKGQEEEFEIQWAIRHSRLHEAPGFIGVHCQKGQERENHVLYMSLTMWQTEECFLAWRNSERFRESRKNARNCGWRYLYHSQLAGFDTLLDKTNPQ